MSKLTIAIVSIGMVVAYVAIPASQQVPKEFKSREFMRRKLEHSQKVLEGLVQEDFEMIEKNARLMSLLSTAAEWQTFPSAEYKEQSLEFRRNADALTKMAANKNLDGATLKYVELTMNCVDCHKHVRSFPFGKPSPLEKNGEKAVPKKGFGEPQPE